MRARVLGLDIGGANLKAAHTDGFTCHRPFALWKHPSRLADELARIVAESPGFDRLAVTMTGELCDCFASKREGVAAILDAVESAAARRPIDVWTADGDFTDPEAARHDWLRTAAANWLAAAAWAGRFVPAEPTLMIDCGSTTTDITPIWEGVPRPFGLTDTDRLRTRELVYTGARRTPLCALLGPDAMAEFFATTLDVYLLLESTAEDPHDTDTADGRPATRDCAHARIARMVGGDADLVSRDEALDLARQAAARQADMLRLAARDVASRLPERPRVLMTAGSGEFLAQAITDPQLGWTDIRPLSLTERLGADVSRCLCAHAVAMLSAEAVEP